MLLSETVNCVTQPASFWPAWVYPAWGELELSEDHYGETRQKEALLAEKRSAQASPPVGSTTTCSRHFTHEVSAHEASSRSSVMSRRKPAASAPGLQSGSQSILSSELQDVLALEVRVYELADSTELWKQELAPIVERRVIPLYKRDADYVSVNQAPFHRSGSLIGCDQMHDGPGRDDAPDLQIASIIDTMSGEEVLKVDDHEFVCWSTQRRVVLIPAVNDEHAHNFFDAEVWDCDCHTHLVTVKIHDVEWCLYGT
ncbi:hypothetical protein WJX73_009378 [Symbiochloris irregularis]|uniref:Uncharacterized protein n=1 Tax=Symbiochloris irregularis TaxID=706552 RepID=A0AAW1PF71_9CHLO